MSIFNQEPAASPFSPVKKLMMPKTKQPRIIRAAYY